MLEAARPVARFFLAACSGISAGGDAAAGGEASRCSYLSAFCSGSSSRSSRSSNGIGSGQSSMGQYCLAACVAAGVLEVAGVHSNQAAVQQTLYLRGVDKLQGLQVSVSLGSQLVCHSNKIASREGLDRTATEKIRLGLGAA